MFMKKYIYIYIHIKKKILLEVQLMEYHVKMIFLHREGSMMKLVLTKCKKIERLTPNIEDAQIIDHSLLG